MFVESASERKMAFHTFFWTLPSNSTPPVRLDAAAEAAAEAAAAASPGGPPTTVQGAVELAFEMPVTGAIDDATGSLLMRRRMSSEVILQGLNADTDYIMYVVGRDMAGNIGSGAEHGDYRVGTWTQFAGTSYGDPLYTTDSVQGRGLVFFPFRTACSDLMNGTSGAPVGALFDEFGCSIHTITSCASGQQLNPGTRTADGQCAACPTSTFSAAGGTGACTPHVVTSCLPGQQLNPGTRITDGQCAACPTGTFSAAGGSEVCTPHAVTSCASGTGLQSASATADGVCLPCSSATFSATTDDQLCAPWGVATCPPGKGYTAGTAYTDARCTVCNPSSSYSAYADRTACTNHSIRSTDCGTGGNYLAGNSTTDSRCKDSCAAGTFKPTTDSVVGSSSSVACAPWTVDSCPIGAGFVIGSAVRDASCVSCEFWTQTSTYAYSADDGTGGCLAWSTVKCGTGQAFQRGTNATDSACAACEAGSFSATEGTGACAPFSVSACDPGYGYVAGTSSTDASCQACTGRHTGPRNEGLGGTYSSERSTGGCQPYSSATICSVGSGFVPGTSVGDNSCAACATGKASEVADGSQCLGKTVSGRKWMVTCADVGHMCSSAVGTGNAPAPAPAPAPAHASVVELFASNGTTRNGTTMSDTVKAVAKTAAVVVATTATVAFVGGFLATSTASAGISTAAVGAAAAGGGASASGVAMTGAETFAVAAEGLTVFGLLGTIQHVSVLGQFFHGGSSSSSSSSSSLSSSSSSGSSSASSSSSSSSPLLLGEILHSFDFINLLLPLPFDLPPSWNLDGAVSSSSSSAQVSSLVSSSVVPSSSANGTTTRRILPQRGVGGTSGGAIGNTSTVVTALNNATAAPPGGVRVLRETINLATARFVGNVFWVFVPVALELLIIAILEPSCWQRRCRKRKKKTKRKTKRKSVKGNAAGASEDGGGGGESRSCMCCCGSWTCLKTWRYQVRGFVCIIPLLLSLSLLSHLPCFCFLSPHSFTPSSLSLYPLSLSLPLSSPLL